MPAELKLRQTTAAQRAEAPARQVFDTAVDADGAIWLATADGLFRRAPAIWETRGLPPPERTARAPSSTEADALWATTSLTARNGDLWFGGTNQIAWRHRNYW